MDFKQRIQEGLDGKYKGLNNGLQRINQFLFGWQRGCYYLIGGLSGAAKTTLVDFMLLEGILDAEKQGITINIFYYCFEIREETKKANWLSILIFKKYNKVISPEKIKGLGDFKLTLEEQKMVEDTLPELERIWSKIKWIFTAMNPTGIYKEFWRFMEARGKFEEEEYIDEAGNKKNRIIRFINNDPKEYNFIVGDHAALQARERGYTLKENLDKSSEYMVTLRNIFNATIVWLQQFNQGLNNFERQQFKGIDLSPSQSDFKDSSNLYTDSDVVLGLLNPFKMQIDEYLGYNINLDQLGLKHRFRALKIVKNRLSRDDVMIGLLFHPEAGRFKELPLVQEMKREYYEAINKL